MSSAQCVQAAFGANEHDAHAVSRCGGPCAVHIFHQLCSDR